LWERKVDTCVMHSFKLNLNLNLAYLIQIEKLVTTELFKKCHVLFITMFTKVLQQPLYPEIYKSRLYASPMFIYDLF
jgi:hypothetical protein